MSQTDKLYRLLSDYEWHLTPEILEKVYGASHLGIARISARILDVKRKYVVDIESESVHGSLWKYRLKMPLDKRQLL